MGVHGLSSFLHENQRTLAQSLTLPRPAGSSPVPLVVDGWSFIYRLHNESRLPWVFGGEYDAFHEVVRKVVSGWIAVGFELFFVFDGPYIPLKFKTGIARVNEGVIQPSVLFFRTSSTSRGSPRFLRETAMLPSLCYTTTIAALRTFEDALELHFADGEGDPFAVELAGRLGAFVAGQDSDFAVLNSEGYAGYLPMDEMLWSTASEDESLSQSTSSLTLDDDGFKVARPKGKANRDPVASKSQIYGLIPPDTQSSSDLSLKCTLYTPHALASHFNLPISLLPLLGALVGNDFTAERKPIHNLFFERNFSAAQRLSKVATTLHSVLPTSSATKKRPKKPITSVVDIIELAVDALLLRSSSLLTSGERDSLVEKTIEAALQYAIPGRAPDIAPELWSTPSCAIHSPERCPLVEAMSRPLHDTGEDDDGRPFRADARTAYIDAYRQGRLDPRIVDAIHTATMWPKLFLEDPDLESVTRSITRPLREWMYAILEAGVGLPSRAKEETEELSEEEEEAEESDEDELVDVVEEDEDEEDYKNDPLAPLRGALQQLNFAESDADTDAPSVTSGAMSAGAPARNVIVTEHVRRGTHLAEEDIPVRPLRSMLKLLGEDDFFEAHAYTPPALWPAPARFTFFLRILASDTPAIRALTPRDLLPILSLRWVVGRLHTRAMEANGSRDREKERWTQREAQAFLSAFGTSSDAAAPEADSPPPNLTNRNVQLVAQVLTSISTIRQLAQALILSEQVPDPAPRFSGTRFHTALADPFHCSISDEVWTAAVGGLEHAFAAEKVKPNKKGKKEAQLKARTSDKARGINGRQGSFSLLSMLEDE